MDSGMMPNRLSHSGSPDAEEATVEDIRYISLRQTHQAGIGSVPALTISRYRV
jgi:hypothetical protein